MNEWVYMCRSGIAKPLWYFRQGRGRRGCRCQLTRCSNPDSTRGFNRVAAQVSPATQSEVWGLSLQVGWWWPAL
jgi:hypothetical protein